MPRRPRFAAGGLAYHVLNRRAGRLPLFEKPADYAAFEKILAEAQAQTKIRIAAYCLMPNHWHLLFWPRQDGELSEVLRWITVTHTQRWHVHHHTSGTGPVYQGRFKLTTWLSAWPVERPRDWIARVNRPQTASELESLRVSVQRGRPFGEEDWARRMTKRFGMEATLRPRGRPKGS